MDVSSTANMLRRIASLSHQETKNSHEHMSPQSGDVPSSPESHRAGGFANVLRGLASSKLSKASPTIASPSSTTQPIAEFVNAVPVGPGAGLSPNHMESFEQLKNGSPNERIAAANTLRYAIAEYPLNPVLDIWYAAKDLIDPAKSAPARIAGWELLTECVKHASSTDLERQEYFTTLSAPANPDDFHLQLAALVDLTNHGRVLTGFDYELIPLLTIWLKDAYDIVRTARRSVLRDASRGPKASARGKVAALGEEKNFSQVFSFLMDVVKFSFNNARPSAVSGLIETLLTICISTSVEGDLRSSIAVIDTIVTFGFIPDEKLKDCVQVLSSIFSIVNSLQEDAWHTLSNLCKSHNGQVTVRILLDILRNSPTAGVNERDVNREIRGAIAVLQKLLSKSKEDGYPAIPYALLADGLKTVVNAISSTRLHVSALQLINCLFDEGDGNVHPLLLEEDWSVILETARKCSHKAILDHSDRDKIRQPRHKDERPELYLGREMVTLITRLDVLLRNKSVDHIPRHVIVKFLTDIHHLLPDATVSAVLDYFQEFRCCSPSDLYWEENLALVLNGFFDNRDRSSHIRLRALETIMDAYEVVDLVGEGDEQNFIPRLAKSVLQSVAEENDVLVLDAIVSLMVSVVASCDMKLFDYIVAALRGISIGDRLTSPASPADPSPQPTPTDAGVQPRQSLLNVVARGYVKMFLQTMNYHGEKSVKLFDTLVNIATSSHCDLDARLTAMKLLFRLRADWTNRIYVTKVLETNFLAAALCRTEDSFAKRQAEEASQAIRSSRGEHSGLSRSSRGISFSQSQMHERGFPIRTASTAGAKSDGVKYQPLWGLPDPEALPGAGDSLSSPMLVSHLSDRGEDVEAVSNEAAVDLTTRALNITAWLEAVLNMLQGSDWEVYSFIIVHLPSQLSNHAVFRDAIPQVQELRRVICELLRTNSFQEPPNASGLRRADVAICLFHSMTMLISYHEHFQKGEEDEMVRTFVHGIAQWERSAKCCIHALTICCHELPLSTSKSLVQLLTKMSTIITQPHVAIHILEFLACLSRLHHVFVNFKLEEYKIVFGICFRYLQSVKDRKDAQRYSYSSEPSTPASSTPQDVVHPSASDDLPQYVYALAYHVMIFWFLALKLPDRANLVWWIVKNLFTDVDDISNANEEALTTLDFMQRVTYADVDESSEDKHFTEERFGEIIQKQWIVGNSIVTIKQASTSGWALIVKRQPTGMSAYTLRETLNPPPPHQVPSYIDVSREGQGSTNTVLPSHLMVHLLVPGPQMSEAMRPIPLPEEEAIDRAMRTFDRIPTVDGHKAGIIYIGEGQTQETEILANVSGSNDYVEFLNNVGTLTKLKGATFNAQGLNRSIDEDGPYTFCWRDRVTEIVFHVTTQMPTNLERDPHCNLKKRHTGNNFVNIIFNDSGLPFKFDTFPSEFNYVNIVITPVSKATFMATRAPSGESEEPHRQPFYRVQVMSKPGFPEISPASETKIVSLKALPGLVRLIALNASVFSNVWASRKKGEHISPWQSRLREIKRLRERYSQKAPNLQPSASQPALGTPQPQSDTSRPTSFTSLRRTSVATFFTSTSASEQPSHRSSMLSTSTNTNDTEIGTMHGGDSTNAVNNSVDFSRWA